MRAGSTAQTWDIGGNEANFFVRDLTGGSRLPLRIRPGAPTSSLDIAASGDIGIGTASPSAAGTGGTPRIAQVHNAGTSVAMLSLTNTDAASGAFPGQIQFASMAITNTEKRIAIIAATKGDASTTSPLGSMVFFTANGGSPAERMRIDNAGNVGIGAAAPTAKLDVNGTVRVATLGANPPANTVCFSAANVLGTCASDARLKHNVRYLQESAGLDAVMKLKPATFQWQDGDERVMAGFIAQETQAAIPGSGAQAGRLRVPEPRYRRRSFLRGARHSGTQGG